MPYPVNWVSIIVDLPSNGGIFEYKMGGVCYDIFVGAEYTLLYRKKILGMRHNRPQFV